jgi:hypothetical protein
MAAAKNFLEEKRKIDTDLEEEEGNGWHKE